MAQSLSSRNENCERVWFEEYDRVPLKQRLKILLASQRLSGSGEIKTQGENGSVSTPPIDIIVKKENEHCDSQGFCMDPPPGFPATGEYAGEGCRSVSFVGEENAERLLMEKFGETGLRREIEADNSICSNQMIIPKLHDSDDTSLQDSVLPNYPVKVKALVTDNNLMNTLGNSVNTSFGEDLQAIKVKSEAPDDFLDDLDHIVLKERKRILLSRKSLGLTNHITEGKPLGLSTAVVNNMIQHNPGIDKEESHSVGKGPSTEENENTPLSCKTSESGSSNGKTMASPSANPQYPPLICSSKNTFAEYELCGGKDFLSGNCKAIINSALSTTANVKVEPLDYNELRSTGIVPVKSEVEITDELDHMLLRERMKLPASREVHDSDVYGKFEFSGKIVTSALDCKPVEAESAMPLRIKRTRKRKKTATDSVETALEEDAPGLLQVLINKGVLVDEIKLYGEAESNEVIDDSLTEDSFADLEDVISKLFSKNPSLLKLAPVRCTKGEKASYCLACLISLVEQARYLMFRKWPVEWGWCRDLQSFIFVFERHNRIVLERPEYGYATYFFELVDSLPVDWQIKRLVTVMKLTSCSRVTLIENRALTVGEDMNEGEARVLMEYGWVPNSGFGTMLNYRDRVVHDRKNDSEISEWRSKIGKLLMDGYNGGRIVSTDIPENLTEYDVTPSPQIKLEI